MPRKNPKTLNRILKRRRVMHGLTLKRLSEMSGVSASYLGRIERKERFPSASVLRKIAQPLGFGESELLIRAGYLAHSSSSVTKNENDIGRLDPYVAGILADEPVSVQRVVIGLLGILKNLSKSEE